jgi:hypothetical protein
MLTRTKRQPQKIDDRIPISWKEILLSRMNKMHKVEACMAAMLWGL